MRRLLVPIAATSLGLVVGSAACGSDSGTTAEPASSTTPTIGLEPSSTTTTPGDAALADLLLTQTLDGFATVATEVLDLETAAARDLDADPDTERARLEAGGFVRGAARTWASASDDVIAITTYVLGSPLHADRYLARTVRQLEARGAERFAVPDVDGGLGFTTVEDAFVAHAVLFTLAERWFLVLVGSADGARTAAEASRVAAEQAAALA